MSRLGGFWVRSSASRSRPPPPPMITIEEVNIELGILCQYQNQGRISEKNVRNIQTYLRVLDDRSSRIAEHAWTHRPRIYAILRNIGTEALRWIDNFIQHGLTDFNLPFTEHTLPQILGEKPGEIEVLRRAFFACQDYYLTDKKDIESEVSRHMFLAETGDTWYVPLKPLGQGGFGLVDLVFSRLSTDRFARKRVLRARGTERSQEYLIRELRELRLLSHHHLVRIIGSYTDPEYVAYLMKPVAEGTLEEFVNSRHVFGATDKVALRRFYGCLATAMNYLYQNNVRHRDLSARNILIDGRGEIYISDFGSSYSYRDKPASKTHHRDVPVSPDYMAPEIAKGDERGTKSDLFSLGMVFLEMTTRLLGQRPSTLKARIAAHAENKTRPYPYANLVIVIGWMGDLGKLETGFDHDKEPLGWIRDLLHENPEHRLTPPQLMKYILESPSFGVFRCLRCEPAFYNETLAVAPMTGVSQALTALQTRETMDEVRDMLGTLEGQQPNAKSQEKMDSISRWMEGTNDPVQYDMQPPPGRLAHGYQGENVGRSQERYPANNYVLSQPDVDRILYSTYEHEFYHAAPPEIVVDGPDNVTPELEGTATPQMSSIELAELPGDMSWVTSEASHDTPTRVPKPAVRTEKVERNLRDSGLGFLEYASNSSDDEDDGRQQLFEELSDRSTVASAQDEEDFEAGGCANPQQSLLHFDTARIGCMDTDMGDSEGKPSPTTKRDSLGFEEEEDLSDLEAEVRFEEASDRSETSEEEGIATNEEQNMASNGERNMVANEEQNMADGTQAPTPCGPIIEEHGTVRVLDPSEVADSLPQATPPGAEDVSAGTHEKTSGIEAPPAQDSTSLGEKTNSEFAELLNQWMKKPETKVGPPKTEERGQEQKPADSGGKDKKETPSQSWKTLTEGKNKTENPSSSKPATKSRKNLKASFSTHVEYHELPPEEEEPHVEEPSTSAADGNFTFGLSEANLRALNEETRATPRSPRKRAPVMPPDVKKLISNTWDMASSAPTSVISKEAKAKISSLFFLFPTDAQIESIMTEYCRKGSASAVRELLLKGGSSKTRPLKHRQYFIPLLAAVSGASGRHNKCVRSLLEAGVDPNHRSKKTGKTPLHVAVENANFKGYSNLVWLLLSNKADPNARDRNGDVPLMKLFFGPDTAPLETHRRGALMMLLHGGASPNITLPGGTGTTPLHQAVRRQDAVAAAVLLHHGADVNAKTGSGTTPLQMCANQFQFASGGGAGAGSGGHELSAAHAAVLDVLLANSASVDEAAGALKRTALHWAVLAGSAQAVVRLLAAGASARVKDKEGCDAVALAIMRAERLTKGAEETWLADHVEIMLALVKAAGCSWASRLEEGKCAVETACVRDPTLLKGLLARKMCPTAAFREDTILEFANKEGSEKARQLLGEQGGAAAGR